MIQMDMFTDCQNERSPYGGDPPSQKHSGTSQAAAAQIKYKVGDLHRAILSHLLEVGGATDEQLMDALDMGGNTERPRRRELQLMGYIEDSGKTAVTRSGRSAVVWILSQAP